MRTQMLFVAWITSLLLAGVCADEASAATVTRGPYLQLQTPTSMTVVWLTDTPCVGEVEWGATTSYGQIKQATESVTRHEIAITGLTPDTLYHYRVRCGGTALTGDATFKTAPPDTATAVSFAFVGDSCSAPANATRTYNAMLPEIKNGFCVTVGDLAGRGEDNITDYWKSHFFDPARDFLKHVAMFPCLGNHELYDESSFPDYVPPVKYLANWSLPTENSGTEVYYSFDKAHVHFTNVTTFWEPYTTGSAQHTWLGNDLAATNKTWKIVYGHNAPYVSQGGAASGSSVVRTHLVPLFEQHGVDLYLCGHYHEYQRNMVNGVTYMLQGTGGQSLGQDSDDSQSYVQTYANNEYCFTRLDIQGTRLLGYCRRTTGGDILDGFQLDKPPIAMPWRDAFPAAGPQLNWIAPWNFTTQCGLKAQAGNPSGDGHVFQVGDSSGHQYAYPMLANESLTACAFEAQVYYDATASVKNRYGIGVRGRQFFSSTRRCGYLLTFVRNDTLAANGHCVLLRVTPDTETVLATWEFPDVSGWHKMKLSVSGSELSVWIDEVLKTETPIEDATLPKGRPFIYNYRASSAGAKTLVDDVVVSVPTTPATAMITDFEGYADGVQVLFRHPSFSGSTNGHLESTPNSSQVVTASAFGGSKVYQVDWAFLDADPQRWLRLSTSGTGNVPNPAVDLTRPIRFRCRLLTPGSLRVCLGIRETGVDVPIGQDGGKTGTIEWLGADSVVSGAPQGTLVSEEGGKWHTLVFDPRTDSVQAFTGDGVLSASNNKGVLEHLGLAVVDQAGPWSVQFDFFEQPEPDPIVPPIITANPGDSLICPGMSANFTVTATGEGDLLYRWQRNGNDLTEGGHYSGVATANLLVSIADAADAGHYRCVVTNAGGSTYSNQGVLTVKPATEITQQPASQVIAYAATAVLSVTAIGAGSLSYQWRKDGADLVDGGVISGAQTATLQISNFGLGHDGSYRCAVTADCGTALSEEAALSLPGPPPVPGDFDDDRDVDMDDFAVLQACLSGSGQAPTGAGCAEADLDHDQDVDKVDLGLFVNCFSGASIIGEPDCLQ